MSRVIAALLLAGSILTYSFARRTISGATLEVAETTVDYSSSPLNTLIPVDFMLAVTMAFTTYFLLSYLGKRRRNRQR